MEKLSPTLIFDCYDLRDYFKGHPEFKNFDFMGELKEHRPYGGQDEAIAISEDDITPDPKGVSGFSEMWIKAMSHIHEIHKPLIESFNPSWTELFFIKYWW